MWSEPIYGFYLFIVLEEADSLAQARADSRKITLRKSWKFLKSQKIIPKIIFEKSLISRFMDIWEFYTLSEWDLSAEFQFQGFLMNRSCIHFSVPNLNLKFCFKMVGTVSRDLTGLFRWTKFTANYCDTFAAVCGASTNTRKYSNTYNKQTNKIPICVQTQSA